MASNLAAPEVKSKIEGCAKGEVEVIGVPRHPVVAVINVRVSVMPSPMHKLDCHDVIWYVNEDLHQSSCVLREGKYYSSVTLSSSCMNYDQRRKGKLIPVDAA